MNTRVLSVATLAACVYGCMPTQTPPNYEVPKNLNIQGPPQIPEPSFYDKTPDPILVSSTEPTLGAGDELGLISYLEVEIGTLKAEIQSLEAKMVSQYNDGFSSGYMRGYGACTEYFMQKMEKDEMDAEEASEYIRTLLESRVNASKDVKALATESQ